MGKQNKYIVIPGCCDLNRGDQALGWETARIAQDAGFIGNYIVLAERGEPIEQSKKEGYEVIVPVLEHPSRFFENKDNIVYNKSTRIKWGVVALKDFFYSFRILKSEKFRKKAIKTSKDKEFVKTLNSFYECKSVFMKGGGLIQSHGGLMSTYATYYRLYHIFLAQALGKQVYILPNSFGPFEGPLVKWMVRKAFSRCALVTAREKKSQQAVKRELGVEIPCFPDLAFYLQNGKVTRKDLCARMGIEEDSKIVAITMRPYRFPGLEDPTAAYEQFKCQMRLFITWLYDNGYMPLIIEHTFAITSHENDGDCIKDVVENLDNKFYRFLSDKTINCRDLKSIYGCCDYIIGTRFHSLIFSLSNMVPGIAISYDGYKSIGIMKDMKLGDYVIDIADVSAEKLESLFSRMVNNQDIIRKNIKEYINKATDERKRLICELRK